MSDDLPPLVKPEADEAADRSLVDDVRRLAEDGRAYVEAELEYQKARIALAGKGARGVAAWGALALALVFFALMALVVGLLLALSELIGGWAATLVVTLGLLVAAALAARTAKQRWDRAGAGLLTKDKAP